MRRYFLIFGLITFILSGCGGGSSDSSSTPATTSTTTPAAATTYTIGGTISGLSSGSLVLKNNGGDTLTISANSTNFTFATALANSATYAVTVGTQPSGLTCSVSNGTGTVASANVTNVTVTCATNSYTVGGTVSGLASGTSFTIQNNGTDSQLISSNGAYTFATALANGTSYVVSVSNQPTLQYCVLTNGSGTLAGGNITIANIACTAGVNESVLYSFGTGIDGQNPYAGLIQDASGNLYGTTLYGGTNNLGTVFKVTPAGVETVLYSFGTGTDGQYPRAGLIQDASGNLYGTTMQGGTKNKGTVFKVTPAGVETVLYSFGTGTDGQTPFAGLIQDASGNLYGTTFEGGTNGLGTVFKVTPVGVETVLYSFGAGIDGQTPYARLIQDASGNLYGTTFQGGTNGLGTVFKISPR